MQAETLPQSEAEPPVLSSGEFVFVFTDIADSTRLTFTLPPAVWRPARDRFFALQSRLARENGLLWLSPRGDGKFLVFSRPEDAVRFAAALLPAMNSMDWNGVPMAVRVGIAAGFADWLPTEDGGVQDDFVGTPLNMAARICGAARPGEVLTAAQISRCPAAGSGQIAFADLGEVELKGLPLERVFRVVAPGLSQDFPPLVGRGNLDEYRVYSAYFGRDDTIAEAVEALRGSQPVLIILGDPGLGKTRLSLETGQQARDLFTDGVWFVPLEQVRQGALVAEAVAVALGVAPQAGRPIGDVLREFLKPRHALLILDNCEQLLMDEDNLDLLDFIEATLYSYYEKSFEQGGGVVVTGVDITGDGFSWTLHPDVGFSTPNRPVVPQDPRVFRLTTVPNAANQHLYTQVFYFYNYDNETGLLFLDEAPPPLGGIVNGQLTDPTRNRGPIAFGVPCLTGQVCGGRPGGGCPGAGFADDAGRRRGFDRPGAAEAARVKQKNAPGFQKPGAFFGRKQGIRTNGGENGARSTLKGTRHHG